MKKLILGFLVVCLTCIFTACNNAENAQTTNETNVASENIQTQGGTNAVSENNANEVQKETKSVERKLVPAKPVKMRSVNAEINERSISSGNFSDVIAFADKFHNNGKYYLEVEFNTPNDKDIDPYQLDIIALAGFFNHEDYTGCSYGNEKNTNDACSITPITPIKTAKIDKSKNHMIGYAIDFDKEMIYVSIDGNWITPEPSTGNSYIKFNKEKRDFTMSAIVKQDTLVTFNFGEKNYVFPVPEGYKQFNQD